MKRVQKNWLEWTVFGGSALLILAVFSILIYESATLGNAPAAIHVSLGAPEQHHGLFSIPVWVKNDGDETAEGVHVEVTLRPSDQDEEERADFEIAFVPRRAIREGRVIFKTDPSKAASLEARVLGFEKP